MILTEKEARNTTCCGPPVNHPDFVEDRNCIESACMAWRWAVDPRGEPAMKKEGDEYRETGYCGLAGEPESCA
jgi:hypothetical protein